jgi:hypothetical protein
MLPPEDISPVLGVRPLGSLSHSDASSVFTHHSHLPKSKNMSQSRKLSLDPHVRLKIEKLEVVSRIWLFFSSPGPKVHVLYCHHFASVVGIFFTFQSFSYKPNTTNLGKSATLVVHNIL